MNLPPTKEQVSNFEYGYLLCDMSRRTEAQGGTVTKSEEIMAFLHEQVFDPIIESPIASRSSSRVYATPSCESKKGMPKA